MENCVIFRVKLDGCSVISTQSSENQCNSHPSFSKIEQSSSSVGFDFTNLCSSSLSSLQQSSLTEQEEHLCNTDTYPTGCCHESGAERQNIPEDPLRRWKTKHGSLDRRNNAQNRFDENCFSGSLDLPECPVSKSSSKPESTTGDCFAPSNRGQMLRKNDSERSHNRRRERMIKHNITCVSKKGSSALYFYHLSSSFEQTLPASPSDFKPLQLGTPMLYIASPKGKLLNSQISSESLGMPCVGTIPTQCHFDFANMNDSGAGCEQNRTESECMLTEGQVFGVLDSPDKLAVFRKGCYGRVTGSVRASLPEGHNRDAVDALFKHNEESLNLKLC